MNNILTIGVLYLILSILILLPVGNATAIEGVIKGSIVDDKISILVNNTMNSYRLAGISTITSSSSCSMLDKLIRNNISIEYLIETSLDARMISFDIIGKTNHGVNIIYSNYLIIRLLRTGNAYISRIKEIPPNYLGKAIQAMNDARQNKLGIWDSPQGN